MWRSVYDMITISVEDFIDHPGKHLPIAIRVDAGSVPASQGDVSVVEDVTISGEGFVQLDTLYVEARIRTTIERPCSRCLAPVRVPIDIHEAFEVAVPVGSVAIDLSSQIMGFILASLDPRLLCRADCRGLCSICGADLNEHPDHTCREADADPPKLGDYLR